MKKTLLVTGSSGLIGSEVCAYFSRELGYTIHGVDNNQRAVFFGPQGDTRWNQQRLAPDLPGFVHHELDIRNRAGVLALLKDAYELPYDRLCMHEFVLSARSLKREHGVTALDVAKRLMDHGIHPPTIYFPLVVQEALMIEPTETETKERLDEFVDAMRSIAKEAATDPETLKQAPLSRPVRRLDEVKAAKQPVVRYAFDEAESPDRIETG